MNLRMRLFLWVGLIFLLAFGVSIYFEINSTDRQLEKAESSLRQQILDINEETRKNIENYLHVTLSEDQAEVDSLLLRIVRDPYLGAQLFIDPADLEEVAPAHSAFIFKNARWIDFLQSTKDGALTSLLIPIDFPMLIAHQIPINDKMGWIILDKDKEMKHPYIGVKLLDGAKRSKNLSIMIDELIDIDWGLTVFFDPEALLGFEKKPAKNENFQQGINLVVFENAVLETSNYLKSLKQKYGSDWVQKAVRAARTGDIFAEVPADSGIRCMQEGDKLNTEIIELLQRGDQAIMLSSLASLFPSGSFGDTPFAPGAPKGIIRFPKQKNAGYCVLTDEAFYKNALFDDKGFFNAHPPLPGCEGIGSGLSVIAPPSLEQVFVGNTMKIEGDKGTGYLTVGIDAEDFVEALIISVNQSAFLVHNGEVITAFCKDGSRIHNPKGEIPFKKCMLQEKSGLIEWRGESYYFLHMIPFKNLDLHFYIMQPKDTAFAFVRSLSEGSKQVIHRVSWNMRIIAVIAFLLVAFFLNRVTRKITTPIAGLARATADVAKGKLEGIQLPEPPHGEKDEVSILIRSFSDMIKGLQEKEKVKGVLNKVVSPQIAEEITKGQVHLGGEEKKITVLFADIRDFTHMTANKAPQDVIEMLNTCMTKISHVIDENEGVIDKYVGDEVMALFGAPIAKEDSALKAVLCSLEMKRVLEEWNSERKGRGEEPVEMGFGIHTGVVLVGNMGAENRLNYTVIGSNVNLAARLCSAAKRMEILISKETLDEPHVKESIDVEQLPPTELKGFDESIILFRVKGRK